MFVSGSEDIADPWAFMSYSPALLCSSVKRRPHTLDPVIRTMRTAPGGLCAPLTEEAAEAQHPQQEL